MNWLVIISKEFETVKEKTFHSLDNAMEYITKEIDRKIISVQIIKL